MKLSVTIVSIKIQNGQCLNGHEGHVAKGHETNTFWNMSHKKGFIFTPACFAISIPILYVLRSNKSGHMGV